MKKLFLSCLLLLSSPAWAHGKKPVTINGVSYQCLRYAQNTLISNYIDTETDPTAVSEYTIYIKAGPLEAWKPQDAQNIEVFVWCDAVVCSTVVTKIDDGVCKIREVIHNSYDEVMDL